MPHFVDLPRMPSLPRLSQIPTSLLCPARGRSPRPHFVFVWEPDKILLTNLDRALTVYAVTALQEPLTLNQD
jgi:hypothetical protein